MNILISIDSFKGSMTSMQAGKAAEKGILRAMPDADISICPLADGGEGTTDALKLPALWGIRYAVITVY